MSTERSLTCDEVRDLAPGFVLGALDPVEEGSVRDHLATCGEGHPEVAELASGLPGLWESIALVEPPPALRSRILAAAEADRVPQDSVARTPVIGRPEIIPEPLPVSGLRLVSRRISPWAMRIAAVLAIAVVGAWNIGLQGQVDGLRSEADAVARVVEAGAAPNALTLALSAPTAGGPVGLAAITADGTVLFAMHDLDPTRGADVYEAWVILAGAPPTPIGSFTVGASGFGSLVTGSTGASAGTVVAITREPGPGATTPTLPIVAAGTAPPAPAQG